MDKEKIKRLSLVSNISFIGGEMYGACCDPLKDPARLSLNEKERLNIIRFPVGFSKLNGFLKEENMIIKWVHILQNDFEFDDIKYHGIECIKKEYYFIISFNAHLNEKNSIQSVMLRNHLIRMIYKYEHKQAGNTQTGFFKMYYTILHYFQIKEVILKYDLKYDPFYTYYLSQLIVDVSLPNHYFFPTYPMFFINKVNDKERVLNQIKVRSSSKISNILSRDKEIGATPQIKKKIKLKRKEYLDAKSKSEEKFAEFLHKELERIKIEE